MVDSGELRSRLENRPDQSYQKTEPMTWEAAWKGYIAGKTPLKTLEDVEKSYNKKVPLQDIWKGYVVSGKIPLKEIGALAKGYYIGRMKWEKEGTHISIQYGESEAKSEIQKMQSPSGPKEISRAVEIFNEFLRLKDEKFKPEIHFSKQASTKHHPRGLAAAGFTNYKK